MITELNRKMKGQGGFNMIELMVVVVIVGILAAIAVPIYSKYAKNARVTEATGKLGDILTAAKSYAVEHESDNDPTTADWPAGCGATNFVGDCTDSQNFSYAVVSPGGALTITATGKTGTPMEDVIVKLGGDATCSVGLSDPTKNGHVCISGM